MLMNATAYMVTKAAAIHLSIALGVIAAPKIRVNVVSPGLILTEWGMKFPEAHREKAKQNTKLKRLAPIEVSGFQSSMWIWTEPYLGLCRCCAHARSEQLHHRAEYRCRQRHDAMISPILDEQRSLK